jgi:hypothetical protein
MVYYSTKFNVHEVTAAILANHKFLRSQYWWVFFSGSAAQRGLWPPRSRGFLIRHNDAPQSVGLLWTSDQLVAETSTWQHTTNIHAACGIRTHDRSRRAVVDLRLRPFFHLEILPWNLCWVWSCRTVLIKRKLNSRTTTALKRRWHKTVIEFMKACNPVTKRFA